MLAFADRGLFVTSVDSLDPHSFVLDPHAEVSGLYGRAEAERWILRHDALDLEVQRVRRCLSHPRVRLLTRTPSIAEVVRAAGRGASTIVSLNVNRLAELPGFTPHFVVVTGGAAGQVMLDNPGPPGVHGQVVSVRGFESAWCSPGPAAANMMIVGSDQPIPLAGPSRGGSQVG